MQAILTEYTREKWLTPPPELTLSGQAERNKARLKNQLLLSW